MGEGFSTAEFEGRRAVVTGGASGIGKATSLMLAEAGAQVVVTDVDEAGGAAVAEQAGGTFAMLDVSDPEAWDRVVSVAGPFDIAFLNAGIGTRSGHDLIDDEVPSHPLAHLTDDLYRRIMSINLDGVVYGARAVLPGMVERGSGDIVATASVAGLVPMPMDPVYGLTKHGVVGVVRALAAWFARTPGAADVCVSALCPGFTDTNILNARTREFLGEAGMAVQPVERVADTVHRMLTDRVQGAEWIIWPDQEPRVYEWNPAVDGWGPSDREGGT